MSLKQISYEKRILFLKLFTKELIKAAYQEQYSKHLIKTEKLKQRFIQPNLHPDLAIKQTIKSSVFEPSKYSVQESKYPEIKPLPPHKTFQRIRMRPIPQSQSTGHLKKPFLKKLKKQIRKQQVKTIPLDELQIKAQVLQQIQPQYNPKPISFNLGKIEMFFQDPSLQSVECPGPGKNILVKKQNKISPTRTILSQQEINSIINSFSQEAKIPVIGGILKAAVGNLIISAVVSEFVGSRFIINKLAPPPVQLIRQQPIQIQQAFPLKQI